MKKREFKSILIVGLGLIGSSLARAIKEYKLSDNIFGLDNNLKNIKKCINFDLLTNGSDNLATLINNLI